MGNTRRTAAAVLFMLLAAAHSSANPASNALRFRASVDFYNDDIERAAFRIRTSAFDPARIEEPVYAEELVRSVELLHAAIPQRAQSSTTRFSAYRAPTAGPSVTPPRA